MTSPNEKAAPGKSGNLEVYPLDDPIVAEIRAGNRGVPAPRYSRHWPDSPLFWSPLPEELPSAWHRAALEYGDAGAHQRRHDFGLPRLDYCARSYSEGFEVGYRAGMMEAEEAMAELQRQAVAVNRAHLRMYRGKSFADQCRLRGDDERANQADARNREAGL